MEEREKTIQLKKMKEFFVHFSHGSSSEKKSNTSLFLV